MKKNSSSVALGILLIAAGVLILMNQLDLFRITWDEALPILLLVICAVSMINVARGNKHSVFWATACGVAGIFLLLRNFDVIDSFWFMSEWPVFLASAGLGFIAMYVAKPAEWGVLIPGAICTFFGVIFILDELDVSYYTRELLKNFWPIVLVLAGLGLILGSLRRKTE